jgi:hypothetical protein
MSKNKPNNPELWGRAKAAAKSKFSVYPCVPLNSLALSKEGWKSYKQLKTNDEICTFNIKENCLEWKPILNLNYYENAKTVNIRTPKTNFNFICTPNHKWVLSKTWNDTKLTKNGDLKESYRYWHSNNLIETSDINYHMDIRISARIKDNTENFKIENFSKYNDDWVKNVINMNNSQREAFFASAIIYDGHEKILQERFNGRSVRYGFSQKNENHGDALEICATLLGYRISFRNKSYNSSMRDWSISNRNIQSTQNIEINDYKNMDVWCPTTENHTWIMKQNGMITITGNSAYANLWAAKWYKQHGGTWRKASKKKMQENSIPTFLEWLEGRLKKDNEDELRQE